MKEGHLDTDPWAGFIPLSLRKPDPQQKECFVDLLLLDDRGRLCIGHYVPPMGEFTEYYNGITTDAFYQRVYDTFSIRYILQRLPQEFVAFKLANTVQLPRADLYLMGSK